MHVFSSKNTSWISLNHIECEHYWFEHILSDYSLSYYNKYNKIIEVSGQSIKHTMHWHRGSTD